MPLTAPLLWAAPTPSPAPQLNGFSFCDSGRELHAAFQSHPPQCTRLPSNSHKSTEHAGMLQPSSPAVRRFGLFSSKHVHLPPRVVRGHLAAASSMGHLDSGISKLLAAWQTSQPGPEPPQHAGQHPGTGPRPVHRPDCFQVSPTATGPGSALQSGGPCE